MIQKALKLENASPQQILAFRISQAIKKFQKHPLDTASPGVQGLIFKIKNDNFSLFENFLYILCYSFLWTHLR
jgi:hypothetical protein